MIRVLDVREGGLDAAVQALERPPERVDPEIHAAVEAIVTAVRERGDDALVEHTSRLDGFDVDM